MNIMRKHVVIGILALVMLAGVALLPLIANSRSSAREIALVARGMSFYLADDLTTPNPTLVVAPGERVRIVLRNVDAGLTHNFAVPSWKVAMPEIVGTGIETIALKIPAEPGRIEYNCTPHAVMMKGVIEVR